MLSHVKLTKSELLWLMNYLNQIAKGPDKLDKKLYKKLFKINKMLENKNEKNISQ
jgi:hypothetical protein